jgi:hypothetical protein
LIKVEIQIKSYHGGSLFFQIESMEPENEKEIPVPPNMYLSPICNVLKNRKIIGTFPKLIHPGMSLSLDQAVSAVGVFLWPGLLGWV